MTRDAPWILASASPRRAEILATLGLPFEVLPAQIDESVLDGEVPADHVERLARGKAAAVATLHPGRWVLAGDTIVVRDREILGKPRDEEEAVAMLVSLSGREHRVLSALALVGERSAFGADDESLGVGGHGRGGLRIHSGVQATTVRFRSFDEATARAYASTGEPYDKAGAYGIQGRGAVLVEGVRGDYSGVVGLPVSLLVNLLEQAGRPYRFP